MDNKIAIIGFGYNGYDIISKYISESNKYLSILYTDKENSFKKVATYNYEYGFDPNGNDNIYELVLTYCNKKNPFYEQQISAEYYIICYNFMDCKCYDLIIDIVKKINSNKKKIVGIFSKPFSFQGKIRNDIGRNKLEEILKYIDKSYVFENDMLAKIIKVSSPNMIGEAINNINLIFYLIAKQVVKQIEEQHFKEITINDIKNILKSSKIIKIEDE